MNGEGDAPTTDADNLYVFERDAAYPGGRLAFVAKLSESDSADWSVLDERPVQATPDGRFLVFSSAANVTGSNSEEETQQIYEYDALEQKLVRVSVGQAGYASGSASANARGSTILSQAYSESKPTTAESGLAISADGSEVVFGSAGALTAPAEVAAAAHARKASMSIAASDRSPTATSTSYRMASTR